MTSDASENTGRYTGENNLICWVNGTFGVGKTTTATAIVERQPRFRLFDPEIVGYMLQAQLKGVEFDDFQELGAWRRLVPLVAAEVAETTGQGLVAVQTVLSEHYWKELHSAIVDRGFQVFHIVLDCGPDALKARILADEAERSAEGWRLDHIEPYQRSRSWLLGAADLVVDVETRSPDQAAADIIGRLPGPAD